MKRIPTGAMGSGSRSTRSPASPRRVANGSTPPNAGAGAAGSPLSSAVTTIQPRSGPDSWTSEAYWGCVTAPTHPVLAMKNSSSARTDRVLVVTPTAPTVAHAYQASTISGQLSAWISTLSPAVTPRPARPTAIRRTSNQNSA